MYQSSSELAKLRGEKKKMKREKAQWERRGQRLKNRVRRCTEGERKNQNHRLITRGAAEVSDASPEGGVTCISTRRATLSLAHLFIFQHTGKDAFGCASCSAFYGLSGKPQPPEANRGRALELFTSMY